MKKSFFAGLIALAAVAACLLFLLETDGAYYYTQIDNSRAAPNDAGGGVIDTTGAGNLDYAYTLPCYGGNGREKTITFGAARELRANAFLRLTVVPVRGVVSWEEVQYGDLPPAVQKRYAAPPQPDARP